MNSLLFAVQTMYTEQMQFKVKKLNKGKCYRVY